MPRGGTSEPLAPGNGLGLSLVAAVARLHGAQIETLNSAPGLTIQLCFPAGLENVAAS